MRTEFASRSPKPGCCIEVIDATHAHVPVVKPQSAFFEELGPCGVMALARVCEYASNKGLIVIMDAKRNDIGTTAAAYAKAYLGNRARVDLQILKKTAPRVGCFHQDKDASGYLRTSF